MQPQLQCVEIKPARRSDHNLAIDYTMVGQRSNKSVVQLGKVAVEGAEVATLYIYVAFTAIDDGPEAVPFGLVEEAAAGRERLGQLGKHGLDGRVDGKRHEASLTRLAPQV